MRIIGHEEQIKKLNHIIELGQIANAYIFEGIQGIGKQLVAKMFANQIMGNDNYILIEPEGNVIKVDVVRGLREEIMLMPTTSDRKVAIINDAECMNEQAQNALLKILEEPPEYATIILITSNKEKLLHTIKSRCISFKFNALTETQIKEFFGEDLTKELIEYSGGSIGTIIKIKDNNNSDVVEKWVQAFKDESLIEIMKNIGEIKEEKYLKENLQDFIEYMLFVYYKELKSGNTYATYAIDVIEETRSNILRNANVDISLDRMAINLWKWRRECKKL